MDSKRWVKLTGGMAFQLLFFGVLLFGPAGTFHWARAWVLLALILCADLAFVFCSKQLDPGLIDERMKPLIRRDQPMADKILVTCFVATYAAAAAFVPLDLFHLHLFPKAPLALSLFGLVLLLFGGWLGVFAVNTNRFASTVVRNQEDRGHTVVETGPYAVVRHPMYAGFLGLGFGLPLWLGSYAGVLAALVPCLFLAVRLLFEEQFLRRRLAGYEEYTRHVRFRLIPGLW